jgi:hypothetical protein
MLFPQCLAQCLVHTKYSITNYRVIKIILILLMCDLRLREVKEPV